MGSKKNAAGGVEALVAQLRDQGVSASIGLGQLKVYPQPTGIASLDSMIGIGGFPKKRLSILVGYEASGKTLIALRAIAYAQRQGIKCAFVDAEHALTPQFATMLGVDIDELVVSQPQTLEEGYNVLVPLAKSGLFGIVVYDSAVALATQRELESMAGEDGQRAAQAQVHSQELRKLTSSIHDETAVIMINQLRESPNSTGYGPNKYMPGGKALRFSASLILDVRTRDVYRDSRGLRKGHKISVYAEKNKVGVPYRKAEFDINYESGIDEVMNLIDTALLTHVIEQRGTSWFYYTHADPESGETIEEYKWNGRAAMDGAIREDEDLAAAILRDLNLDDSLAPAEEGWDAV